MSLWKDKYEVILVSKHHRKKALSKVKDKFQAYINSDFGVR
jgi:hypothetical protein